MPTALTVEEKRQRAEDKRALANGTRERKTGRRSFNGTRQKLAVDASSLPDYHLHIFNDDGTRILEAKDAGYDFVNRDEVDGIYENVTDGNTDVGSRVRFLVGRNSKGDPMYAFLMKIKKEFYEEDSKILQDRNDRIDQAILTGNNPALAGRSNEFYSSGTKISH